MMSSWIVFLIVIIPLIALLGWIASTDAVIKIPPGKVGLLLIAGRATDKVVEPGLHWVPRLRKRMVAEYPSLELSLRAVPDASLHDIAGEFDRSASALTVMIGDRAQATIAYTLRFRLDLDRLRSVHEHFGPEGVWTAARDIAARTVRVRLREPDVSIDDLYGTRWTALEEQTAAAVADALSEHGMLVTMFGVDDIDLGRTGEIVQAIVRARVELEREEAEAELRRARARIDSELEPYLASVTDAALRYREVDVLRDLVHAQPERVMPMRSQRAMGPVEAAEAVVAAEAAIEASDET